MNTAAPRPFDPAALGRQLRAARAARNPTQAQLAAAAGITRPHLAQIEAGTYSCKAGTLFALADALAVGLDELRGGSFTACAAGHTLEAAASNAPSPKADPCPPSKSTAPRTTRRPAKPGQPA